MPTNYTMLFDVRLVWPTNGQYCRYCWGVYQRDDPLTILAHFKHKRDAARYACKLSAPFKRA